MPSQVTILETENLDDILEHLTSDAAIFCDLDNTLLESCQHFGTVQWFEYYERQLLDSGKSPLETEEILQTLWTHKLLPEISVRLLDASAPNLLSEIRQKGHLVMGLTARYPADAIHTYVQLERLGIQFDQRYVDHAIDLKYPAVLEKGIIYATPFNPKSAALLAFLNKIDYYPPTIVFIDDKMNHIQDLADSLSALNINYIGIRYGKADRRVQEYNHRVAEIQMDLFPQFISDEQAFQLLAQSISN